MVRRHLEVLAAGQDGRDDRATGDAYLVRVEAVLLAGVQLVPDQVVFGCLAAP
jgi:hypothetical protein